MTFSTRHKTASPTVQLGVTMLRNETQVCVIAKVRLVVQHEEVLCFLLLGEDVLLRQCRVVFRSRTHSAGLSVPRGHPSRMHYIRTSCMILHFSQDLSEKAALFFAPIVCKIGGHTAAQNVCLS